MKYKSQLEQLEDYVVEEIKKKIPLVVISENVLVYRSIKIKKTKQGTWNLYSKTGDKISEFKIKTTASLAAKFYDKTDFQKYNLVKILDLGYWHSANDADFFKLKAKTTKDYDKKDLFVCRYELAKSRAEHYKSEITSLFKINF